MKAAVTKAFALLKAFVVTRGFIVLVEVVYLAILFGLAIAYFWDPWRVALPDNVGGLPVGVPWFGALGAVIISLSGTFDHRTDWDPDWNYWHLTRPVIGASLAIVAWLVFRAGILAVGSAPATEHAATAGSTPAPATTNLLYYLIAFVVGYREELFRDLIKRVADVILTPGTKPPAADAAEPAISSISPPAGRTAGGDRIVIAGSGFTGMTSVTFGSAAANVGTWTDTEIVAVSPAGIPGDVRVTVVTPAGGASRTFTYR
jgi:hypothetical protein